MYRSSLQLPADIYNKAKATNNYPCNKADLISSLTGEGRVGIDLK